MVNYKDLGLVNTREMFAKAVKGGYAIPAFNFNNMEQLQAIIQAAVEDQIAGDIASIQRGTSICQSDAAALYGRGCCGLCQGIRLCQARNCIAS